MVKKITTFFKKHKRHLPTVALVAGLIFDSLTLGRPDQLYGNLVLLTYLFISGGCIVVMARRELMNSSQKLWIPVLTQFSFGNLTSGLLVLYIGSATLVGSWPFLLILVGLMIGNEIFTSRHQRLLFSTAVFYLLILAYCILLVPVLTHSIASWTFLVSVFLSIGVIVGFLLLLRFITGDVYIRDRRVLLRTILAIAVVFSGLYYTNLIPPVPLSAREVGIFHTVTRTENGYQVSYEKQRLEFWRHSDSSVHINAPTSVACFSSIFAPTELTTPIEHVWERYNESTKVWEERGRFDFPIAGGRDAGYRGYSIKTVNEGKWRCSVETSRGVLLGRASVTVIQSDEPQTLTTESR